MRRSTRDQSPPLPPVPRGVLAVFDELLRTPTVLVERAERLGEVPAFRLVTGAVLCFALYGAASGVFQGGPQILVASLKAPLIIFGSLLLCIPSLYVLSSLCGVEASPFRFIATVTGFGGMLALLLMALMPIAWLFSVSSSSLGFMIFVHTALWVATLGFAFRFLVGAAAHRGAVLLLAWLALYLVVSLQVASQMRPVLWRPEEMALFAPRRVFFLEHFARVASGKEGPTREQVSAAE